MFSLIVFQARVSGHDVGTETTPMFYNVPFSSTPVKDSVFIPRKRPRLVLEEEEEEDSDSQLLEQPHDSTYNMESVVTEESELL